MPLCLHASFLHAPLPNKRLRQYPKPIRDPRDVIEVPNHLGRVVDGPIVEPVSAERVQIRFLHRVLVVRELGAVGAERLVGLGEGSRAPVANHGVHQLVSP